MTTEYKKEMQLELDTLLSSSEDTQGTIQLLLEIVQDEVVKLRERVDAQYSADSYLGTDPDPVTTWDLVMMLISKQADQCMQRLSDPETIRKSLYSLNHQESE